MIVNYFLNENLLKIPVILKTLKILVILVFLISLSLSIAALHIILLHSSAVIRSHCLMSNSL